MRSNRTGTQTYVAIIAVALQSAACGSAVVSASGTTGAGDADDVTLAGDPSAAGDESTGDASSGDAAGDSANGDPAPPPIDISGTVYYDMCRFLDGVSVRTVDNSIATLTDQDGVFAWNDAPSTAFFRAAKPGYKTTLSFERDLRAAPDRVFLAIMESGDYTLLHLAALRVPNPAEGTINVSVVQADSFLPIEGATVELLRATDNSAAGIDARYATFVKQGGVYVPLFLAAATTGIQAGLATFFAVPPGDYILRTRRDGYGFEDVAVRVEADVLSMDVVPGVGSGGTRPVQLGGNIAAYPPHPQLGPPAPLAGAEVTLTLDDGLPPLQTATDSNGDYLFDVPYVHRWADITVSKETYGPLRTMALCLSPLSMPAIDMTLREQFLEKYLQLIAAGSEPLDPTAGQLAIGTRYLDGNGDLDTVSDATVSLSPDVGEPYYGRTHDSRMMCAVEACGGGGVCPSGRRCEDGQCVLGESGPSCSSCDTEGLCPAGYSPEELPRIAPVEGWDCFCLQEQTDCLSPDSPCPDGTFCRAKVDEMGATRVLLTPVCVPYGELANETIWGTARFVNVAPGDYIARASSPTFGMTIYPMRLRVTPGVLVTSNFQVRLE